MPPKLSILLPHKHTKPNDAALQIALSCIVANTANDYELLLDTTTPADPYLVLNSMAQRSTGEWLFFGNSDLFMAPGWDTALLAQAEHNVMVTATLVECGAIGVHNQNIHRNFGMSPASFNRAEFEAWVATSPGTPSGSGFYFYALLNRQDFIDFGMFDTTIGAFPTPLDIHFWERWLKEGKAIRRAPAFCYHLQNYSNEEEQQKAVRGG